MGSITYSIEKYAQLYYLFGVIMCLGEVDKLRCRSLLSADDQARVCGERVKCPATRHTIRKSYRLSTQRPHKGLVYKVRA